MCFLSTLWFVFASFFLRDGKRAGEPVRDAVSWFTDVSMSLC